MYTYLQKSFKKSKAMALRKGYKYRISRVILVSIGNSRIEDNLQANRQAETIDKSKIGGDCRAVLRDGSITS